MKIGISIGLRFTFYISKWQTTGFLSYFSAPKWIYELNYYIIVKSSKLLFSVNIHFFLFNLRYMHAWGCTYLCFHMWKAEVNIVFVLLTFSTLFFEIGSVTEPEVHQLGQTNWPERPQSGPTTCLPNVGVRDDCYNTWVSLWKWVFKRKSLITLPSEPTFNLHLWFLNFIFNALLIWLVSIWWAIEFLFNFILSREIIVRFETYKVF